ncbi:MAG: site-2 protease family protein [Epsilonproteobacteria bacterium]|nr:site-2 protease family protein [Campylobacterota bacterium]
MSQADILRVIASILALAIAIIGHEIMHGYIAYKYGDDTAKRAGRLTINPISHIDPIGTILVPAILYLSHAPFLFGWAKPVPVDMNRVIRNGGYSAAIAVALAGITYNLIVAALAATLLPLFMPPHSFFELFILYFLTELVIINVVLAVFNLWPIPPLDGSQALLYLALKFKLYKLASFYERIYPYGMMIVLLILFIPQLSYILFLPVQWILDILLP